MSVRCLSMPVRHSCPVNIEDFYTLNKSRRYNLGHNFRFFMRSYWNTYISCGFGTLTHTVVVVPLIKEG